MLEVELPSLDGLIRAKTTTRLPTVLTRGEVQAILLHLFGTSWLIVRMLYGAGLRLNECPGRSGSAITGEGPQI